MAKRAAAAFAVLAGALVLTLAVPFEPWRTGRTELAPLSMLGQHAASHAPGRIWIDTDAACGHGARTDPDDCLAILALAGAVGQRIVGISTVFGNAPLEATDRIARALAAELAGPQAPAVHSGAAAALPERGWPAPSAGAAALRDALAAGPLTLVALGPLTNVAQALHGRPDLAANVERLVAVMGRRPGHLFHPAEGAGGAMLLGHGPVFRDFNFEQDRRAVAEVLTLDVPIIFIPYDAARHVEVTAADLERWSSRGGATAWVAARSRAWLQFWNEDIGRAGFYPFDLLAAAYVIAPERFACARVEAAIGKDPLMPLPWRDKALLVAQRREELRGATPARLALYCPEASLGR